MTTSNEVLSPEVKQLSDKICSDWEEFKKTQKEIIKAECKGHVDAELVGKLERINEAITIAEDAKDAAEKAQAIAKSVRTVSAQLEETKESKEWCDAFKKFMRRGEDRLNDAELSILNMNTKRLSSASDTAGGYTVIPFLDTEITRIITEESPIRRIARTIRISTDQYERLQIVDAAGCYWEDRDEAPVETDTPPFKKLTIKVHKLVAEPVISQDLIDDSYIDIEAELAQAVALAFSQAENTAFVLGDGVGCPRGFLDYPAGTTWGQIEQINSGAASALTYAGLINLQYALKDGYADRASFVMRRGTVGDVRKMTDLQGNPLWMPGFGSEPSSLLGYPVIRTADMPAVGAGALAIAFGDFSRGYFIIDRIGTRVLRDPYTSKPFVKFYTTKRVGGAVNNYEAIKIQKISA